MIIVIAEEATADIIKIKIFSLISLTFLLNNQYHEQNLYQKLKQKA
jgi:hypothetical protein